MNLVFVSIPRTSSDVFDELIEMTNDINIHSVGHSWLYPTQIKGWRDWDFPNQQQGINRDVGIYSLDYHDRVVTIIRNPFDLLFSYFKYNWAWCRQTHQLPLDDYSLSDFQKFVDIYLDDNIDFHAPAFKKSMFSQLKDKNGNWVLSKDSIVMRYERLKDDIKLFSKLFNVKITKPLNIESEPSINPFEYYRYDQIQKLRDLWKDDLDYFNYDIGSLNDNSTKVKPKIALCLSGLIRDIDYTKKFWLSLVDKYDIDVYGSFWDDENIENNDTIKNLKSIYNFKEVEFEKYSNFKKSTLDIITPYLQPTQSLMSHLIDYAKSFHTMSMWYKVWRANLLSKNLDIQYDIVIRGRTDTIIKDELPILINDYLNIPSGKVRTNGWKNSEGISDLFAYGKPKLMDYYSSIYLNLLEYVNQGHYMIPPENLLRVHMSRVDVQLRFFTNKLIITRFSKGSKDEVYDKNIYVSEEILPSNFIDVPPNEEINFTVPIRNNLKF
jgi:hypothetical protein